MFDMRFRHECFDHGNTGDSSRKMRMVLFTGRWSRILNIVKVLPLLTENRTRIPSCSNLTDQVTWFLSFFIQPMLFQDCNIYGDRTLSEIHKEIRNTCDFYSRYE